MRIAARLELEAQHLANFDLDDDEARDVTRIAPELRVEMTYEPDDDFLAFRTGHRVRNMQQAVVPGQPR